MNHKYKILSGALLGAIIGIPVFAQQFYQCVPCESGYDCSSGARVICPDGKICLNGVTYNKSSCKKSEYKKITTSGSSSLTISIGYYEVDVAGGGGSSARSDVHDKLCNCSEGGAGGAGALNTYSFFVDNANGLTFSYTVGAGGSGGDHDGYTGGTSTYEVKNILYGSASGSAAGGSGGKRSTDGTKGADAGNGKGGAGGGGKGCSGWPSCKGKNGDNGANGWITIYKYEC